MKILVSILAILVFSSGCSGTLPESSTPEGASFAVLRFKVSGCMSCSHCRSVIRQVERDVGEGRTLSVGDEEAELRFFKPGFIDIKAETERLLSSGIIRFQIHEVELRARGTIKPGSFVVEGTGQEFRVEGSHHEVKAPREVTANVMQWQSQENIALKFP